MIILDANILKGTSLRGPAADVLRAIRATGVERVAAPWIAVEEIAAQQALAYQEKHNAAIMAVEALRKATPWAHVADPWRWPAEHVREHWRERYSSIAEVIETSPAAYQQAMFREANLIAPCKTSGKDKIGARDAAIWLTAVEYARAHEQETVYFISNNPTDFGDGTSFPAPMDQDIRGMEDRFFLFTSLDGILTKFATELEAGAEDIQGLLDTGESRAAILQAARAAASRYGAVWGARITSLIDPRDKDGLWADVVSPWRPTNVALSKVLEVSGREVGGHHWFTAWVRWLLTEGKPTRALPSDRLAYAWETRVLLSTTADRSLTVLDFRRPGPIAPEDVPGLPREENQAADPPIVAAAMRKLFGDKEIQAGLVRLAAASAPDLTPFEEALGKAFSDGQLLETLRAMRIDEPEEEA
ncbi:MULTISPECIES: PIN domain-containing protein [unclassified Streptomyces]|uniref:PIN domain-containing protein n=1 Tax=unclassified Streptomyces TaxID=2593676 RepID=UPI0033B6F7D0